MRRDILVAVKIRGSAIFKIPGSDDSGEPSIVGDFQEGLILVKD
jgi:hypothetical protein